MDAQGDDQTKDDAKQEVEDDDSNMMQQDISLSKPAAMGEQAQQAQSDAPPEQAHTVAAGSRHELCQ